MSATTLNLPYTRFVAQVSTAPARSKSTYLALMAENLAALKLCPWREAADVPVSLADHDFTAASHISDAYDAFKMTGNYDSSAMTEIAYAGMAAYRFKIPDSALVSGSEVALSSISLPISRDRFLKRGLRVAVVLSAATSPSTDWDVVRGEGGVKAEAELTQIDVANLLAGTPADGSIAFDASTSSAIASTGYAYLWVYITLEDYTDAWEMYSTTEKRLYAIEGSAMLVGGSAEFTFADSVVPDSVVPSATPMRLVTTSYSASGSVYYGNGLAHPVTNVHRVFPCVQERCYVTIGGRGVIGSTPRYGLYAPALTILYYGDADSPSSASVIPVDISDDYKVELPQGTTDPSPSWDLSTAGDIEADWLSTPPGIALWRGVGVTGAALVPALGAGVPQQPAANSFKFFTLYVSTKDGCWICGTCRWDGAQDHMTFFPRVRQVGPGGDLMLLTHTGYDNSPTYPFFNACHEWYPECVSVGSGVIRIGTRSIPFEGTVSGLGSYAGMGSGVFIVAGRLVSVNGVPCNNVAIVNTLNDPVHVSSVFSDGVGLVPNVFDNFRVVYAGGTCYALGDFTYLNGVACAHGAATFIPNNGAATGITPLDQYVVDVAHTGGSHAVTVRAQRTAIPVG